MNKDKGQLIVALDVGTLDEAKKLVYTLDGLVDIFKVGSQLFASSGPEAVRSILRLGKKVFLDLKFHDIPHTVASAVRAVTAITESGQGILMCTLHTLGGLEMLRSGVVAAQAQAQIGRIAKPWLVGITVLTSEEKEDSITGLVLERALLAKQAGLAGVVASSQEAALIRRELGDDFLIVTPGIRPSGTAPDDQRRITTPQDAIKNGSNFLVVGRPIIQAKNPAVAAKQILEEIKTAVS